MIVICTQCQAKFRVAEEKIGPRGAKVRCSKCQNVFVIHRELGSMPLGTPPPAAALSAARPAAPQAAAWPAPPVRAPAPRPPPSALDVDLEPRAVPPAAADPFAAPPDPFAPREVESPFAAADPFAPAPSSDDPFLAAALAARAAPARTERPPDPLSTPDPAAASAALLAQAADPFAASVSPRPPALPVTDLSDLLGASARAPSREAPALDDRLAPPEPPEPPPAGPSDLGIALEDRVTPPAFARGAGVAAADPFGDAGPSGGLEPEFGGRAAFETGAFDPAGPGAFDGAGPNAFDGGMAFAEASEPLRLATETTSPGPPPLPAARPPAEPAPAAAARPVPARAALPAPAPARLEPAPSDRIPGGRGSRFRAVAVNALALAALLVVALAIRVLWSSGGRIEPGALRPSAILGTLRRGSADGPFAATEVRNGLYDRERAPPVLFVRGTVVARAGAPTVPRVRVAVELVRDGTVLARGEATAGAVPTPEELWRAADDAALAEVAERAKARAPRSIRAGDAVPFLVALADYPADLGAVTVRVALAPAAKAAPGDR